MELSAGRRVPGRLLWRPDGHPHTCVLWVAASMKMLLCFLLTASSFHLLSYVPSSSDSAVLRAALQLRHWWGLSSVRLALLPLKRRLHLLVSQFFKF